MGEHDAIRVLWVSPTISTSFGGPTTTVVNGLIAESRAGLESSLISTTSGDDEARVAPAMTRLGRAGLDVKLFRRTRWLEKAEAWGFSIGMVVWMMRNLRRFDIVHLQYVWCLSSICGSILARLHGIPVVITPHESLTAYDIDVASRSKLKRRVKLVLKRLYLRTADCFVFMSKLERQDTSSGSVSTRLIAHAVQEAVTRDPPSVKAGADDPLRIAFIGRNIAKKGIDLIIRAIGRNPDRAWTLSIAGPPGPEHFRLELRKLIAELDLADRVRWLGYVDKRQDVFAASDVLAMPSAYEGFGMVAAEAMCAGVPVVVPRRSGVAEIVAEYGAGIVMPESSVENLERALKALDDDPAGRLEYGRNGLLAANSRLTYEAYGSSTRRLYDSLLST